MVSIRTIVCGQLCVGKPNHKDRDLVHRGYSLGNTLGHPHIGVYLVQGLMSEVLDT